MKLSRAIVKCTQLYIIIYLTKLCSDIMLTYIKHVSYFFLIFCKNSNLAGIFQNQALGWWIHFMGKKLHID